jgi:hypothetical protein
MRRRFLKQGQSNRPVGKRNNLTLFTLIDRNILDNDLVQQRLPTWPKNLPPLYYYIWWVVLGIIFLGVGSKVLNDARNVIDSSVFLFTEMNYFLLVFSSFQIRFMNRKSFMTTEPVIVPVILILPMLVEYVPSLSPSHRTPPDHFTCITNWKTFIKIIEDITVAKVFRN